MRFNYRLTVVASTTNRYKRCMTIPKPPKKSLPVSVRMAPEIKAELERLAVEDRRSLSSYIEGVLADHVFQVRKPKR